MKAVVSKPGLPTQSQTRILGVHDEGRDGPTLIFMGGIHGNEPAGVQAMRRVLKRLGQGGLEFQGKLHAVAGNLPALARGQRFVDRDLNRAWDPIHVRTILDGGDP